MWRWKKWMGTAMLACTVAGPLLIGGCAARGRYYDSYYTDNRPWDYREERAYRAWMAERRYEYREYRYLSHERQHEYWHWRHDHPDRY